MCLAHRIKVRCDDCESYRETSQGSRWSYTRSTLAITEPRSRFSRSREIPIQRGADSTIGVSRMVCPVVTRH